MHYIRPRPIWATLTPYVIGGLIVGLTAPTLQSLAAAQFGRPGVGSMVIVNLILPALFVGLSAIYPDWRVALGGTLLGSLLFLLLTGHRGSLSSQYLVTFIRSMRPVLFVACIAYHVLAFGTAMLVSRFRRVGEPPHPQACPQCGYLMIGLPSQRCPECGGERRR
ncbi:MAG: hypothetical protein HZB38_13885 [Planctomycetes bacterium]|nr:hypothetical protein [Planctomycetota bacterium]